MFGWYLKKYFIWLLVLVAAFIASTTVAGVVLNYSVIPVWDMWNGYLEFYFRSAEGWAPWWELHNEHRLVLAKSLFWLDLKLFAGNMIFLFCLNIMFAVLVLMIFALFLKNIQEDRLSILKEPLLWVLMILAFSWLQHENFIWAFQSQFFLAYIFPLFAFYLLGKSGEHGPMARSYFIAALAFGLLSPITMANGLLALPLLTVQSVFQREKLNRIFILAIASIAVFAVYFHGYERPAWQGAWSDLLADNTLAVFIYFLAYLGAPLYFLVGKTTVLPATLAGAGLIGTCIWLAWPVLRGRRIASLELALLTFILFIGGTALSTALGRAGLGPEFANFLPSRYQTPSTMGWSALFLLLYCRNRASFLKTPFQMGLVLVVVPFIIAFQMNALKYPVHLVTQEAAVLASFMGIRDQTYIDALYYDAERFHRINLLAIERNLSTANLSSVADTKEFLGKQYISSGNNVCIGYVDNMKTLPLFKGQGQGLRYEGWIYDQATETIPEEIVIVDASQQIVGYGVTGLRRGDVALIHGKEAAQSGFIAYIKGYQLEELTNTGRLTASIRPDCSVELSLPLETGGLEHRLRHLR